MREIPVEQITETVKRLCIEAACNLPGDAEQLIKKNQALEESQFGKYIFGKIQ